MIPEFPKFKKLELSDKEDVEKFTSKFTPTSDFNFAGTWSWDVREQMQISQLNGNYVVRFIDYLSGTPFYTFLGINQVNDTVKQLLDLSIKEGLKPELKLIPEYMIENFDTSIFKIEEDRDNFDYIYDLEELKEMKGGKYEFHRRMVNKFLRNYSNFDVKILDLNNIKNQNEILELHKNWLHNKRQTNPEFESNDDESVVLKNFFKTSNLFKTQCVGVYIDSKLSSFCINELIPGEYSICHLAKADVSIGGVYSFLMKESSDKLFGCDKKYLNYEQDMGIKTLRHSKESFNPIFLKKYLISYLR